jgi:hypothetical protein
LDHVVLVVPAYTAELIPIFVANDGIIDRDISPLLSSPMNRPASPDPELDVRHASSDMAP